MAVPVEGMDRGGAAGTSGTGKGIELKQTTKLHNFLTSASTSTSLNQELQQEAAVLAQKERLPWRSLKAIHAALREGQDGEVEGLQALCKGSRLVLEPPPVREKGPELIARLARLQRAEDQRRYDAMVHDITHHERKAEALRVGGLVNFKDQMSYGLHVVMVMVVFYLIGHTAAASLSQKPGMRAAGGLAGLVIAILMETVLLIIRSSEYTKPSKIGEKQRPVQPFSGTRLPNSSPNIAKSHHSGARGAGNWAPDAESEIAVEPKKKR